MQTRAVEKAAALSFSPDAKKQGALWKNIHFLAKEKNYAEEHCKGFC
jgi:hypothetical protein